MNMTKNNSVFTTTYDDGAFIENELAARNVLRAMRAMHNKQGDADAAIDRNAVGLQGAKTYMNTDALRFTVYDGAVYDFTFEKRSTMRSFIVYHYLNASTNVLTFIALEKATQRSSRITECDADAFDAQTFFDDAFYNKFLHAVKYALLEDAAHI